MRSASENKEEIEALARLTDNLLTLARADAGQTALHREDTDLLEVVREVSGRLQFEAEKRGVDIEIGAEGDTQIPCDRLQIERVFFNLIDNAISYSPAQETVRVQLQQTRPGLRQRAALAFDERNVRGEGLASHALTGVHEAVAAAVHVGIVDLSWVADECEL